MATKLMVANIRWSPRGPTILPPCRDVAVNCPGTSLDLPMGNLLHLVLWTTVEKTAASSGLKCKAAQMAGHGRLPPKEVPILETALAEASLALGQGILGRPGGRRGLTCKTPTVLGLAASARVGFPQDLPARSADRELFAVLGLTMPKRWGNL